MRMNAHVKGGPRLSGQNGRGLSGLLYAIGPGFNGQNGPGFSGILCDRAGIKRPFSVYVIGSGLSGQKWAEV